MHQLIYALVNATFSQKASFGNYWILDLLDLSIMVTLYENYIQHIEYRSLKTALIYQIAQKTAITNAEIKPRSNICSTTTISLCKVFLSWAFNVCLQKYLDEEITFLIDIFTENGHLRIKLEK